MPYEYTDDSGRVLHVHPFIPGPAMEIATPKGTVRIGPDEAPALALAVLEGAGAADHLDAPESSGPWTHLEDAIDLLRAHLKERAEQEAQEAQAAEREAEDAKVRAWRLATRGLPHEEPLLDDERDEYHRNLAHFTTAAKPTPRVLEYGDPEPDRGTRWRDAPGDVWYYAGASCAQESGWHWAGRDGFRGDARPWRHIPRSYFPMTEVTD